MKTTRRSLLAAALALPVAAHAQGAARVVVIGGGFGGASAARALRLVAPWVEVTLVERSASYHACPFSNAVIAGMRDMAAQEFTYAGLAATGIRVVAQPATGIDTAAHRVLLADGTNLSYDRLILSPGIELRFKDIVGYSDVAANIMPHAWKAGPQTLLLRDRLAALPDGGTMVMSVPANPYRCPPGPYERASLIAHYLKTHNPRAKLIVLDAKDAFSKQRLFQAAWKSLYPNLEWVGLSGGGKVTEVDATAGTVKTEFASYKADLANIIPPQRAGAIAVVSGVADRTGWCPIDPVTFESRLQPGIHVIGDAAIAGGMPKSAFAANAQAKVCAQAVADLLAGRAPSEPRLINTCYSIVAPDYGISVAGVYRPANGVLTDIEGAGGTSPLDAPPETRAEEARYAESWFRTITTEAFG